MSENKLFLNRRKTIKFIGITTAAYVLVGCGDSDSSDSTLSDYNSSQSSSSSVSSSSSLSSSSSSSVATETTSSITTTRSWASGGTDVISVDFPDDSLFDTGGVCDLTQTERTTEGPCYLGVYEKDDISEGKTGLPMQICMQLVDTDCNPLQGYLIEVWHCDTEGIYSADTSISDDSSSFAGDFCTGGDTEALSSTWFRGEAYTDSSGRVNFKSCFPGWYSGRTIHIHYRVKLENGGADYIVSQFCFPDDFCSDICNNHELYASRGTQDTPLSSGTDTVFPSSDYDQFIMNISQNEDGSLLAYKRVMIGSETLDEESDVVGSGGQNGTPPNESGTPPSMPTA